MKTIGNRSYCEKTEDWALKTVPQQPIGDFPKKTKNSPRVRRSVGHEGFIISFTHTSSIICEAMLCVMCAKHSLTPRHTHLQNVGCMYLG